MNIQPRTPLINMGTELYRLKKELADAHEGINFLRMTLDECLKREEDLLAALRGWMDDES